MLAASIRTVEHDAKKRAILRSHHPGRPRVTDLTGETATLEWAAPPSVAGFCVSMQKGGANGLWEVVVPDTHTSYGVALVDCLEPETWYSFRVAVVDPQLGTGRGSAPSQPVRTPKSTKRPVELRKPLLPARLYPLAAAAGAVSIDGRLPDSLDRALLWEHLHHAGAPALGGNQKRSLAPLVLDI